MSHSKFTRLTEENEQLTKQLHDTQIVLDRARAEIKEYNKVIDSMIAGGSPCDWCEDLEECQRECKGKGCSEWWLRYRKEETGNDSKAVLSAGEISRGEIGGFTGETAAL